MYTRSCSRFERDRGLNNKTRIHTGNDRRRRGAPRGRGRPCGAHKASPRLISLSPSSCPFSSPCHAAAFPRAENARPVPGIQSERQHRPSLPLSLPQSSFPLHPAVISSTRSPGLYQARPGQARLARSRVPSPVRLSVPLPDRRPVHCTTAASVQCGRARKRVLRGFRYLSIVENKCEITGRARCCATMWKCIY